MKTYPEIERLKTLAAMPLAELRARQHALPELLGAISAVMPLLDDLAPPSDEERETSKEIASLAGMIMEVDVDQIGPASQKGARMNLTTFHHYAQRVAGSALSQYRPEADPNQGAFPLDDAATRALADAQRSGQALPLERTTVLGPDTTGPVLDPDKVNKLTRLDDLDENLDPKKG